MAIVLKLLVSALLVVWILQGLDLTKLTGTLADVDVRLFCGSCAGLLALSFIQAGRWRWVLNALQGSHSYSGALSNVLIGQFFNQTLPSTIGGDAMRVWLLHDRGMRLSLAFNSVLIDRLLALGALMVLGLCGLPWLVEFDPTYSAAWTVGGAGAVGLTGLACILVLDRLTSSFLRWRPVRALAGLSSDSRYVVIRSTAGLSALVVSLVIHCALALIVYVIAMSLSITVEAWHCLVLVPPVMVASAIPISVAGWGVREGAMVAAFGLIGMSQETAFALSVLFGLSVILAGLPGGVIWLATKNRRPADDARS
ncbi:MAG: flippase-like domain-containing protein [Chromatiales bacterium]|jgi:glycosyltransferase 2 family protein|nr:flippase-like domain-containing protein [Chromatiales bacterium]